MSAEPLRIGVVGGGLIAQAVHLPRLAADPARFAVVGIADPSPKVIGALAARYAPAHGYLDWRDLLDREELDAVAVCSPHSTHAEVVLAALDRACTLSSRSRCASPSRTPSGSRSGRARPGSSFRSAT